MLSIVVCAGLGILCVASAATLSNKVDPFIGKVFYILGIISFIAAMLLAATDENISGWVSAAVLVLVLLSIVSGAEHQRRGHL
jgi:hypothetical protein